MKKPPSDPVSTHSHPQPAVRSRDSFTLQQMALQSLSLCCEKRSPWGLSIGSSRMGFCLLVAQILKMLREGTQAKGHSSLTGPRGSEADEPLVSGTAGPRPVLGPFRVHVPCLRT